MIEPVIDCTVVEIELSEAAFNSLPQTARELLQLYGHCRTQGWGQPCRITLARYRLAEIEAALETKAQRAMWRLTDFRVVG